MPEQETILCSVSMRLDAFVAAETELSRTQAQRLIREGAILLNEKVVKVNAMTADGDQVDITYPEIAETAVLPENIPLDVVYEDTDLIVVDKPQGMVVHPAPGHESGTLGQRRVVSCFGSYRSAGNSVPKSNIDLTE